jgi:DNA-binding response OmpR family regulator
MARIALYEVDDLMYGLLREWLGSAGHLVVDSTSAPAASPRADLVIMSVSTSKRDTELLLHSMRRVHAGAPIIALSSQARLGLSSDGMLARQLGVARVMAKPLHRQALVAAVDEILAPRAPP